MQARKLPIFAIYATCVLVLYLICIESPKSVVPDNNSPFKRNLPLSRTDDPVAMASTRIVKVVDSYHNEKKDLDPLVPPSKAAKIVRIDWFTRNVPLSRTSNPMTMRSTSIVNIVDSDHNETDELDPLVPPRKDSKVDRIIDWLRRNVPPSRTNDPVTMSSTSIVKVVNCSDRNEKEGSDPLIPPRKAGKIERIDWFRRNEPLSRSNDHDPVTMSSTSIVKVVDSSDRNETEELDPLVPLPKAGKIETIDWFSRNMPLSRTNDSVTMTKGTSSNVKVVDSSDRNETEELDPLVPLPKAGKIATIDWFSRNMPLSRTKDSVTMTKSTSSNVKVVDCSDRNETEELDPLVPPPKASKIERTDWIKRKLPDMEILKSTSKSKRFHSRLFELYNNNNCSAQFFMVWLSPAKSFGPREMLAVDTLFTTNPGACLAILSNSLDSPRGDTILKPLLDRGFNLIAVTFDTPFLVKNTPVEAWLKRLKSGYMDPGSIPLYMNLSNLTRLAVLYKYGGVYLDTDIIFLNDITRLRNAIGAQSIDPKTKTWSRLNNAVMVFDIYHPLMREFLHEYSTTFDGNIWGHNSPYLVPRVITRLGNKPGYDFKILPPDAFYPVNWIKIPKLFKKPATTREAEWVEKTLQDMRKGSYMIHLWNKVTRKIKIEEGSVMYNLISTHCTVCRNITNSHTV
ncbi:PREDICTED: uncharacterized protein LOC104782249 [Camelina sativa]|uniref:Uncharacterized protein LOC104782249 n=1 Tax=Camelina sativa TaxID=90675 RepID=A0ABM0YT02_CAMSA|nr:PREDICTED: uncharacterized protein LOC104782249 [Camelina sativa]